MDVDPNDYLAEIREALSRYETAENPDTWEDDCQSDAQRYASDDAARVLASYLGPLDGYLTAGGSLPSAWRDAPGSDARALDVIAEWLRDPERGLGMLEDIADVIRASGRSVEDYPDGRPTWDRH